jgi:hypothetical protein
MKKRFIRWIGISVAAVGAAIVGGVVSIDYFMSGFGACKTTVHGSIPSPDASKSIIIFEKECGATVGFNTQVSIAPSRGTFSADRYPPFYVVSGRQEVVAKWLGDEAVEVSAVPGAERTYRREERSGDVKIVYP